MEQALQSAETIYNRITRRKVLLMFVLVMGIVVCFAANLLIGSSDITLPVLWATLTVNPPDPAVAIVIWKIRLPIALMAVVVGAALAVGGCEMQTILRNPMASPYTLGISAAAAFGAAAGIVLDLNVAFVPASLLVTANSFLFAMLAAVLIYSFSTRRGIGKNIIILFGIALNFIFNALTMFLQYVADEDKLQSLVFWTFGSLLKASWDKLTITAVVFTGCFCLFAKQAWQLTALTLSDHKAASLGVDVRKVRRLVIITVSLLTATAVCFVGTIGFIGLVAPHIARGIAGEDQRYLLPVSALLGAFLLSAAVIASKLIIPGTVLPVGLITSLIGIPFFIVLIFNSRKGYL